MGYGSCYNLDEEMHRLRKCGCDRCREIDETKEAKPVINEPKNYAVKLLVDQLKAQQSNLTAKKTNIDIQKQLIKNANDLIKTYNEGKLEIESKIKELSVALKKLGHKE